MRGILGILHEIYLRFLVWLGADPPEGFEYMLPDRTIPDEYTLQEGENLFAVARKFGIHYERIAQANGIDDFESVTPGQTLKLPPSDWSPEDGPLAQPTLKPEPEPFEEPPGAEEAESQEDSNSGIAAGAGVKKQAPEQGDYNRVIALDDKEFGKY